MNCTLVNMRFDVCVCAPALCEPTVSERCRYDLLPFYSRLVATLHPCMPDVAADLVFALKGDFRWHVRTHCVSRYPCCVSV